MKRLSVHILWSLLSITACLGVADYVDAQDYHGVEFRSTSPRKRVYRVHLKDFCPELARDFDRRVAAERAIAKGRIGRALDRQDRTEAINIARTAKQNIDGARYAMARKYPPTTLTVYGEAVDADMKVALRDLRHGVLVPGVAIHVSLQKGRLTTSNNPPVTYDMPKPKPQRTTKPTVRQTPYLNNFWHGGLLP